MDLSLTDAMSYEPCSFFLEKKKRSCRMMPVAGSLFCWQHISLNSINCQSSRLRIPCPLDSKHNCFEDELDKHLKRCNNRKKPQPAYFKENINSGMEIVQSCPKFSLQEVPNDKLLETLKKIELIYSDIPSLPTMIYSADVLENELQNTYSGFEALKHLKQNSSLIGILQQKNLLQDGNLFIEFGAGRGQLSHWIAKTQNDPGDSSFLLIDRASQRHKLDNKIKGNLQIQRLKMDIEHLDLDQVPSMQTHERAVVFSKHLCGAATDLSLRCITRSGEQRMPANRKIKGILIACCCHHRCTWRSYVGKEYLEDKNINEEEFSILQKISGWATCGRKPLVNDTEAPTESLDTFLSEQGQGNHRLDLTYDQRESIGFKSKILLDYGRSQFLQKQGYHSELVHYTHKDISPENVALLATLA